MLITVTKLARVVRVTIAFVQFSAQAMNAVAITGAYNMLLLVVGLGYITLWGQASIWRCSE